MRATMSLPGVFPPVERDGRVLVDGGALNNVPADVVRAMGADVVIAINVGFMGDTRDREPLDDRAHGPDRRRDDAGEHARRHEAADIVINPPLVGFASLDWRRSDGARRRRLPGRRGDEGHAAAARGRRSRNGPRTRTRRAGAAKGGVADAAVRDRDRRGAVGRRAHREGPGAARRTAARHRRRSRRDLETLAGLDRYETVGLAARRGRRPAGLLVEARPKTHAPPFLMLGVSLQNTTSDDFAFQLAARLPDVRRRSAPAPSCGSTAAAGAQPQLGAELYRPIGDTALFVTGAAGVRQQHAQLRQRRRRGGALQRVPGARRASRRRQPRARQRRARSACRSDS